MLYNNFSLPYNQEPQIIEAFIRYSDLIHSIYLPPDPKILGSGRSSFLREEVLKDGTKKFYRINTAEYNEEIRWIIQTLNEYNVKVFLLINATCDTSKFTAQNNMGKLIKYISSFDGLYGVVVSNLLYGREIKQRLPHVAISASVNTDINSIARALYWKEFCDVDYITITDDLNKELKLIKAIKKATGCKIKMIVNQTCMPFCATRFQHQNRTAHIDKIFKSRNYKEEDPFTNFCEMLYKKKKPELAFRSNYVTPYNLRYYKGIVDVFKISGRDRSTKHVVKKLLQYAKGESTFSEFAQMDEPPSVFKHITKCSRECYTCSWCKDMYFKQLKKSKN
jgi:collagenase-like PrtC family protease